jgi:hypothetical protein
MSERSRATRIEWGAVALGSALALFLGILATAIGLGLAGLAACVAAGGALAGRRAGEAGLFHGALVGGAWILLFSALFEVPAAPGGVVVDTLATLGSDLLYMCAAGGGGWLGSGRR